MALWTFEDLLEKNKFDPKQVYPMRHQDRLICPLDKTL